MSETSLFIFLLFSRMYCFLIFVLFSHFWSVWTKYFSSLVNFLFSSNYWSKYNYDVKCVLFLLNFEIIKKATLPDDVTYTEHTFMMFLKRKDKNYSRKDFTTKTHVLRFLSLHVFKYLGRPYALNIKIHLSRMVKYFNTFDEVEEYIFLLYRRISI